MGSVPCSVPVVPLAEVYAVKLPEILRSTFTQYGAVIAAVVVSRLVRPVPGRRWKETPEPGVTHAKACAELGLSVSRIITPAFAQAFVFSTLTTFATIV